MTLVERVARAIAERNNDYCDRGLLQWPAYEDDARAAISALRDPSPGMVEAGSHLVAPKTAVWNWQAMIDAALKEAEG